MAYEFRVMLQYVGSPAMSEPISRVLAVATIPGEGDSWERIKAPNMLIYGLFSSLQCRPEVITSVRCLALCYGLL